MSGFFDRRWVSSKMRLAKVLSGIAVAVISTTAMVAVAGAETSSPAISLKAVGETVEVEGSNFDPDAAVSVRGTVTVGSKTIESTTDSEGSFHVTFEIPDGYSGRARVTARTENKTATARILLGDAASTTTTEQAETTSTSAAKAPTTTQTTIAPHGGSAPVGSTAYAVPAGAIFVASNGSDSADGSEAAPFATVKRALSAIGSAGTVVMREGRYHESVLIPESKAVTIQSYPHEAVWFDGSVPVGNFNQAGNAFSAPWSTVLDASPTFTRGAPDNTQEYWQFVNPAHPMAAHPDQVWIDDVEQQQVGSAAQVTAGKFFVDTAAHKLIIGTNPAGHSVESGDLVRAFVDVGAKSTVRGIGIRRYNPSVPDGGAVMSYANDFTVENVVIDGAATIGLGVAATGATFHNVTVSGSGMLGVDVYHADNLTLDNVVVDNNNTELFNQAPSAGGFKASETRGVKIKNSTFSKNVGIGVWLDESCWDVSITNNDVRGNAGGGIFYEISANAVISGNTVVDNVGDGIGVRNSNQVKVTNNNVLRNRRAINLTQDSRLASNVDTPGHDQRRAIPDPQMTWVLGDITVTGNTMGSRTDSDAVFAVEDFNQARNADDLNIKVDANTYVRPGSAPAWLVVWTKKGTDPNVYTTLDAFRSAHGQEVNGKLTN